MNRRAHPCILLACTVILIGQRGASAGQIEYFERSAWEAIVESYSTVDFVGFPPGTFITDQYADLGINFTDGNDSVTPENDFVFPNDGFGLDGNGDIGVAFDTPQTWIAAEFPGPLQYELYREGELVYTSNIFSQDPTGNFFGLVFADQFDAAVLIDPAGQAAIDDLLFGAPAPGPPAIALFGLGASVRRTRSRRVRA